MADGKWTDADFENKSLQFSQTFNFKKYHTGFHFFLNVVKSPAESRAAVQKSPQLGQAQEMVPAGCGTRANTLLAQASSLKSRDYMSLNIV